MLRSAQISLNFNPPAPCGAGHNLPASVDNIVVFQSTRPVRGGTQNFRFSGVKENNFNPPAPCGAGRPERQRLCQAGAISIHPPRAGRDPAPQSTHPASFYFNPPAPCGAGPHGHCRPGGLHPFQSTRPVRGGTAKDTDCATNKQFQSTRPVRGGTGGRGDLCRTPKISIHPPRAGRDGFGCTNTYSQTDFNPPAPCGAGHDAVQDRVNELLFQSTRPVRGGTDVGHLAVILRGFQSTRPVRGGTSSWIITGSTAENFNPPAPCGAGLAVGIAVLVHDDFNPPAPCGAGPPPGSACRYGGYFNPPAPCGAGPAGSGCSCSISGISIHPPRAGRDVAGAERPTLVFLFQSTRPVRGGTGTERSYRHKQPVISIHPPRAGRDPPFLWHLSPQR